MVVSKYAAILAMACLLTEAFLLKVAIGEGLKGEARFVASRRTLKTATAQLYQACGGLGPNNLPGGITPADNCWATCPSGATCYRQNAYYWQCLTEDPCNKSGWDCSKKCGGSGPGGSPPGPGGSSPSPPAPTPNQFPPIPVLPPVPPTPASLIPDVPITGVLPEFAKCGNEIPFFNVDFCLKGLRCTRKDKYFMQCLKKTEDTELGVYAKGDNCGQTKPYDLGGTVRICPEGTACMSAASDGSGPWKCLESGFYSAQIVTDGQCYAPADGIKSCTDSGAFCAAYDQYFAGCIQRAEWKRLDEGAACGKGSPYSDGFGTSFCPADKPCVPQSDFWTDTTLGTPIDFICSGETVNLQEGVVCGDIYGPFNGYFTCSGNGGLSDGGVANLCVQESDSAWRCRKAKYYGNVVADDYTCGVGAPYFFPEAPDAAVFCSGATSSCWLYDKETSTYGCAAGRCPTGWDCQSTVILPKSGNPVVKYCGPFAQTPGWAEAVGAIFVVPDATCDKDSVCIMKDPYGIFQCLPWSN